jgi:hypothetical protein
MSLTGFVAIKDVVERFKPFRPQGGARARPSLLVPPRCTNPRLVGTAFDYLVRFEVQRLAPYATDFGWVAEQVPDMLWRSLPDGRGYIGLDVFHESDCYMPPEEASERARAIIDKARDCLAGYVRERTPTTDIQREMAAWAVRLAKLDVVVRARKLDPDFETAATEDVEDHVALLGVVPFERLLHPTVILLNPVFGEASTLVGGADADLISGELLLDIKTTKALEMRTEYVNQLLGYFLLARKARAADPTFPEVKSVGLYFSRYGHLWTYDTAGWVSRPDFADTERWFFERMNAAAK